MDRQDRRQDGRGRMARGLATILLLGALAAPAWADLEELKRSVVKITTPTESGAGLVVGIDRDLVFILTAYHVVRDASKIEVEFRDDPIRRFTAEIHRFDETLDIAAIWVRSTTEKPVPVDLPSFRLALDSDLVERLEVDAIGHPGDLEWQPARAEVTNVRDPLDPRKFLLTNGEIEPGNSGGPIFSSDAESLLGVVLLRQRSYAVALKIEFALAYLEQWRLKTTQLVSSATRAPVKEEDPVSSATRAPDRMVYPGIGMVFRFIPAKRFTMGSPPGEAGRDDTDETQHEVELTRGFWMGETEVTQGQWEELMGNNPAAFKNCGAQCPVENVSWWDAVTYANRLSEKASLESCYELGGCSGTPGTEGYSCASAKLRRGPECTGYRLPTEAEWERAARADTTTALYTGALTIEGKNDGPKLNAIAWYGGNSGVSYAGGFDCSDWPERQFQADSCGTHPVASKEVNPLGLYDMLGNVFEWCGDWYEMSYPTGLVTDPTGPVEGSNRVYRGGSWFDFARLVRAACRDYDLPSDRWNDRGFRLARGQAAPGAEPK